MFAGLDEDNDTEYTVSEAVARLRRRDGNFKWLHLWNVRLSDGDVDELVDSLLAAPDVVSRVSIFGNEQLTDATGVRLARYVAASSSLRALSLSRNGFGQATYLAMAWALRANTSLVTLHLHQNRDDALDRSRIDAAFVRAVQLNPGLSRDSVWYLYVPMDDFERLANIARQPVPNHPTLQSLLTLDLLS